MPPGAPGARGTRGARGGRGIAGPSAAPKRLPTSASVFELMLLVSLLRVITTEPVALRGRPLLRSCSCRYFCSTAAGCSLPSTTRRRAVRVS